MRLKDNHHWHMCHTLGYIVEFRFVVTGCYPQNMLATLVLLGSYLLFICLSTFPTGRFTKRNAHFLQHRYIVSLQHQMKVYEVVNSASHKV